MIDSCYIGDVRDGLRAFIAAGIRAQTCVTSPPYWGLRDYGTAQWEGGDAACDHRKLMGGTNAQALGKSDAAMAANVDRSSVAFRDVCGKCGARRIDAQIGLEPTIAEYVATMVDVFRLVRDVLADDGTLWLNMGDCYHNGDKGGYQSSRVTAEDSLQVGNLASDFIGAPNRQPQRGLKPKDLVGMPWSVTFALRADGWYLRSDIIWHKPNPMPESVTDRPTKAHEYLFLLAKSERYFYDADAIKEPSITLDPRKPYAPGQVDARGNGHDRGGGKVRSPAGWKTGPGSHGSIHADGREQEITYNTIDATSRNRRTVWTIATQPYAEAHFATFPTALVEPCILAGSRPGDIVLDPFMGSGTVAQVAQSLGRRWIGCELNPAYVAMQNRRAAQLGMELHA